MSSIDDVRHPHELFDETGPHQTVPGFLDLRVVGTILDAAHEGMGVLCNGSWFHVNPPLAAVLGAPSGADLKGVDFLPMIYTQDVVVASRRMRDALDRGASQGVLRFLQRDGEIVELDTTLTVLDRAHDTFLLVARDLADRRRLVHAFVAVERSAALGSLAASVAHGINTPLAQVFGNASMMKSLARTLVEQLDRRWECGNLASVRSDLRSMVELAQHLHEGITAVAGITRAMGLFTLREGELDGRRVALGQILDAVVDLTENVIRHRARFVCEIGATPVVLGNEARIGHLLLSTLLASAEAIPEGSVDRHEIRLRVTSSQGGAFIEITDTGQRRGLRAEHLTDPLTAIERGATHAEFALSVCRSLAADMGGTMEVMPLARGTQVTIALPAARSPASVPPPTPRPRDGLPGNLRRGRVLVIDDDRSFLDMTCRILQREHEVLGTHDPVEALGRIERGERFDVILCDMMMPSMSGADLHAALSRLAPHVAQRMVFLTAGAFTERARAFLASGRVEWLDKLCDPEHLCDVVRQHVHGGYA